MVYLAVNETAQGQTVFIADNEFTELEGPIRMLRSQWLGEKNNKLLETLARSGAMRTGIHELKFP